MNPLNYNYPRFPEKPTPCRRWEIRWRFRRL